MADWDYPVSVWSLIEIDDSYFGLCSQFAEVSRLIFRSGMCSSTDSEGKIRRQYTVMQLDWPEKYRFPQLMDANLRYISYMSSEFRM